MRSANAAIHLSGDPLQRNEAQHLSGPALLYCSKPAKHPHEPEPVLALTGICSSPRKYAVRSREGSPL